MFHTKENEKTNDLRLPLNCNTNAQSNNGAFVPSGYPDYCYLNRSGGGITLILVLPSTKVSFCYPFSSVTFRIRTITEQ